MTECTEKAYFDFIEQIAEQVTSEAREYDQDIYDTLHETIDGCYWVVYYHAARAALQFSPNEDAIFDALGRNAEDCFPGCQSMNDIRSQAAYYAILQDVMDHDAFNADEDDDNDD